MSDLILKQFEAWAVIDNQYSIARTYTDLRYDEDDTEAAWDAWQASRECLVIELPIPVDFPDGTGDYHQMIDPDDLIDAIHEAGVKTNEYRLD